MKGGEKMNRKVRSGKKTIVFQVKVALDSIDYIGQSKRAFRSQGIKGIHSYKQKKNAFSDCQNFVKWVRQTYQITDLQQLSPEHYLAYFAFMKEKGCGEGHMSNVETSLRLLQVAMKNQWNVTFCPVKRLFSGQSKLQIRNRSYTDKEIELIEENCSEEVRKAVQLMSNLGLRLKEVVNLRGKHFTKKDDEYYLEITEGAGVTKGGRFRQIKVQPQFEKTLQSYLFWCSDYEYLIAVTANTVSSGVRRACLKVGIHQDGRGCHGFRHSYARRRFQELTTAKQKEMMTRILENRLQNRKADYGILSTEQKQLYQETVAVMNQVHSELGHGENRWALALVYLQQ